MSHSPRRLTTLVLIGVAALASIAVGWWIAKRAWQAPPPKIAAPRTPERSADKRMVHLYFGDSQGRYLVAEQRVVEQPADFILLGRQLVELLIQGPDRGGSRTLPASAKIRAFYVNEMGTAFLDFEYDAFSAHPGGIGAELLSIYSIVNTLVLNVDGIQVIKFLIGGREATTLAGHVDLREPFKVDMLWVR